MIRAERPDPAWWGAQGAPFPFAAGARARVWRTSGPGALVFKPAWGNEARLAWTDRILARATRCGLLVPRLLRTRGGWLAVHGWVAMPFFGGNPGTARDLRSLAPALNRFHLATRLQGRCAIHGDLHPGNVVVTPAGVALIDWDEARMDYPAIDRAALGTDRSRAARQLALRAEIAACWNAEPQRARRLARRLVAGGC